MVTSSTRGISTCQKVGVQVCWFGWVFLAYPIPEKEDKPQSRQQSQCASKILQFGSDLSHLHTRHSTVNGSGTSGRLPGCSLGRLKTSNDVLPPFTLAKGWIPPQDNQLVSSSFQFSPGSISDWQHQRSAHNASCRCLWGITRRYSECCHGPHHGQLLSSLPQQGKMSVNVAGKREKEQKTEGKCPDREL